MQIAIAAATMRPRNEMTALLVPISCSGLPAKRMQIAIAAATMRPRNKMIALLVPISCSGLPRKSGKESPDQTRRSSPLRGASS